MHLDLKNWHWRAVVNAVLSLLRNICVRLSMLRGVPFSALTLLAGHGTCKKPVPVSAKGFLLGSDPADRGVTPGKGKLNKKT